MLKYIRRRREQCGRSTILLAQSAIAFCRLGVLGSRFILMVVISRLLGVEALGAYGLVAAVTAILPVATGFGLHYKMNRNMVLLERSQALALFRDRVLVLSGPQAFAAIIFGVVMYHEVHLSVSAGLTLAVLTFLEMFLFEACLSLISVSESILANILIFVRFAAWVPFFCVLAYLLPAFRTIHFLFTCWLCGSVIACVVLLAFGRNWPWREASVMPRNWASMRSDARQSIMVYFSDMGKVGVGYADRLIVGAVLGLADTGVYSFYWSFANALQTLSSSVFIQPALPAQVRAASKGARYLNSAIRRLALKITGFNVAISAIIVIVSCYAVTFVTQQSSLASRLHLLPILLTCTAIRALGDVIDSGLYARGADSSWVLGNVAASTITVVVATVFSTFYGLEGVAVGTVVTALVSAMLKLFLYLRANSAYREKSHVAGQ